MKIKRKIVEIDESLCDGCGSCVPSCAEGAIEVRDGKARLVAEKFCDGLGACLGDCPTGALRIMEREAEDFDEQAVEHYLNEKETRQPQEAPPVVSKCPSAGVMTFPSASECSRANAPRTNVSSESQLTHWPVQIRLVPPTAPFLKGADLLVAADCTPIAYPAFHQDLLKGKVVLMGCPKFDDVEEYVQRFADIFKAADIRSVTVVDMEVPCCSALPMIVRKGAAAAGKQIPVGEIVIGRQGGIVHRDQCAA
ncbi:MAG: 4Fe-4S binding protein [Deltaproteobacteria bacterium]|nr:4Fe-4S binding protein [Deltaproteobacteria bacterium]